MVDCPRSPELHFRRSSVIAKALANRLRNFAARLRPGALKKRFQKWIKKSPARANAFKRLANTRRRGPRPKIRALEAEYRSKGLDREPDTFVLYRILGNDLYPRHMPGQTCENLAFLLQHEPPLEGCEKRWVVNRIFDPEQEAKVIRLLRDHKQTYLHLPFDWDAYEKVGWDRAGFPERNFFESATFRRLKDSQKARAETKIRRLKNLYVMNNNGARNAALREGRAVAKWVLPWDGNCFVTRHAWSQIRAAVTRRPYFKYFIVPMTRVANNGSLLATDFVPDVGEEPQIVFRRDASEEFDEAHPYGRRPKVELIWRLSVNGDWDTWNDDPWDLPRPPHAAEAGQFAWAGWVARLESGHAHLEAKGNAIRSDRGRARVQAIRRTLDQLDRQVISRHLKFNPIMSYDEVSLENLKRADASSPSTLLVERLRKEAEAALQRGPYSVMDKTTIAPSGDPHDYWHPAPYWWPNPDTPDGLPYVNRDGHRVPGTDLYELGSERYDRTAVQRLFDDTTVLALAWRVTGTPEYAEHGARLVRRWFVEPETRMNPHLRYAQVQRGRNNDEGTGQGVIELRDLHFFLDAVRLLERSTCFGEVDRRGFAEWLRSYLLWLLDSPQGRHESCALNNHATFYDLQLAAVAAYLGDADVLATTFRRAGERLFTQFEDDGRQPYELSRTNSQHYCSFNLQGWVDLADLARKCGTDLWREGDKTPRLKAALEWALSFYAGRDWPHPQEQPFDRQRFAPLYHAYRDHYGELPGFEGFPERFACEPMLNPHYAVKPFWMLG
jgi:alginate lyase